MILKSADDKSAQIAALENLLATAGPLKTRIEQELRNLRAGIKFDFNDASRTAVSFSRSERTTDPKRK
jgi:hypothetical protein